MAVTRGAPDDASLGGIKDGLGGDKVQGHLGSEATVSNSIQAGSITLGDDKGTEAWAIFGKPFTNPPMVVASIGSLAASGTATAAIMAGSGWIYVNQINTGSAEIVVGIGSGGNLHTGGPVINWIAFGTY